MRVQGDVVLRLHLVLRQGWDLTLADHQSAAWRDTSAALETALADLFSAVAGDQQIVVAEFRSVRSVVGSLYVIIIPSNKFHRKYFRTL